MISENYTLWVVLFVFFSNLGKFRHEGIDDVCPIEGDSLKSRVKSKKLSEILFLFFDMFLVILLMEEIPQHQGFTKPCTYWDKLPVN